jgi:CheY-like chemotaxis protein
MSMTGQASKTKAGGINLSALTYLVVDDSRYARQLIKTAMQTYRLHNVVEAPDAVKAMRFLKEQPIDMILVDKEMPVLTGTEFIRLVRKGEMGVPNPEIPIIMISGHTDLETIMEARAAGVHDFLAKPVSADALFARIRANMQSPRPFVRAKAYLGPDRRVRVLPLKPGVTDRRKAG